MRLASYGKQGETRNKTAVGFPSLDPGEHAAIFLTPDHVGGSVARTRIAALEWTEGLESRSVSVDRDIPLYSGSKQFMADQVWELKVIGKGCLGCAGVVVVLVLLATVLNWLGVD